ncbi:MAG TPA: prolyl oligopeptidase family serine peptidase [Rhizomicrobium sp.]|nr:prolyl oligopeptidase family serine peptidase [Rhizomicrobium sp.]
MKQVVRMIGVLALAVASVGAASLRPPIAPKIPVIDDYFGYRITDNYRWMEDRSSPKFVSWIKKENTYARAVLARIPGRDALLKRIAMHTGGGTAISSVQLAGGRVFYLKREPNEDSFKLYMRPSISGAERLLVDPTRRDANGKHFAIDYFQPSQNGAMLVYGISEGGSENSVIHILDTQSGIESPETIDRCEDAGPSWRPDGKSFFYRREAKLEPGANETNRYLNSRALLHVVGADPGKDVPIIGTGVAGSPSLTPASLPFVVATPGSRYALAVISPGSIPESEFYVAPVERVTDGHAPWKRVASLDDKVTNAALHGDRLFLIAYKKAPRFKVLETSAASPEIAKAKTLIPTATRVIEDFAAASDALYIRDLDGGPSRLRRYDLASGRITDIVLPADGTLTGPVTDPTSADVLFGLQGWVIPQRWYTLAHGQVAPLALSPPWKDDYSAFVAEEVKARAHDGTLIPLSIVHKRGLKLDGTNPVWLIGYGAYGLSLTPALVSRFVPLLEDGGVVAIAHVRGGGEYGEEWHMAAHLATKRKSYTDLIDCAEYLEQNHYGSADTMAIEGRSAGGITVGMALDAAPTLFRVVFSGVGDSNALRAEFETDGAANSLEYGSVKTEDGFKALANVDAILHVMGGVAYPAVMLTTGMNDPRVAPWQPGKMAAALQGASSSGNPVILRVDFEAGHGFGSTKSQRDAEMADQMAFFYWQIGKRGYQPHH